jgi:hypothetical protein
MCVASGRWRQQAFVNRTQSLMAERRFDMVARPLVASVRRWELVITKLRSTRFGSEELNSV